MALGIHRTSAQRRANKEKWSFVEVAGTGGREKRYPTSQLPQDVQIALRGKEEQPPAADPHLPAVIEPSEPRVAVPAPKLPPMTPAMEEKMRQKAALLSLYNRAVLSVGWGDRMRAREEFELAYNSGLAWPELYKGLGQVSWKTIETWRSKTKRNGNDCFHLADRRGLHRRGTCGLSDEQTEIFLRCVLRPNKPRIAEAIRVARAVMHQKGIETDHSEATFRRWLATWKSRNYDVWVWTREGSKAWNDKCAYYIERDMSLLQVGDVIVADGHNLNFEIINPWTGKPQNHAVLILFYDMASNMPLGWEIMPTENTQAISSALRRAVLRLGKYPRVVYLDNGRAFKARFFKGSQDFDEAGFAGLYERMGCQTIHAWPYHGQSKTVERFFGTFAEMERLLPTYTGTSIADKPPRMMRGEKKHRTLHEQQFGGRCLSFAETHTLIAAWFDQYAQRPQRGHLDGTCPAEVFEAGRGPGIDKAELTWLMMNMEIKTIHRNGITFQGQNYYHPALVGRRHRVQVRYDLQDTSSIWVLDADGGLICEAGPVEKVHPAAAQLGTSEDKEQLRRHIEFKRSQEKAASGTAVELLRTEILPEHQRQMEQLGVQTGAPGQQKSGKTEKLISYDHEKISRAAAEMERLQEQEEAKALDEELDRLNDADRYERLIELDAMGIELSEQWQGFMTFFEKRPGYIDYPEYWESCRMKYGLMHRASAKN